MQIIILNTLNFYEIQGCFYFDLLFKCARMYMNKQMNIMAEKTVEEFVENFFNEKEFPKNGIRSIKDLQQVQFGKSKKVEHSNQVKDSTENLSPPRKD